MVETDNPQAVMGSYLAVPPGRCASFQPEETDMWWLVYANRVQTAKADSTVVPACPLSSLVPAVRGLVTGGIDPCEDHVASQLGCSNVSALRDPKPRRLSLLSFKVNSPQNSPSVIPGSSSSST